MSTTPASPFSCVKILATFAVSLLAVLLGNALATQSPTEPARIAGLPRGNVWRWQQRLDEGQRVPKVSLFDMIAERERVLAAQPNDNSGLRNWRSLGPGNVGGRIRSIVIHPKQPNTIWIGAVSGGIWKTTNGGSNWTPLSVAPVLTIGCMVMDLKNPDRIYAGTGEGFFNSVAGTSNLAAPTGAGILVTHDGGKTWSQLKSTDNPSFHFVNRIAISPSDSKVLVAATWQGIFRSTDAGATWSRRATNTCYDVDFHPSDARLLVAGVRNGSPIYSTNGGVNWATASGVSGAWRVETAYARSDPRIVYATINTSRAILVYRSTDGGRTYSRQTTSSGVAKLSRYTNVLWVDPTNANRIYAGGTWLYVSTNAGVSLSRSGSGVHADQHIIVEHPGYNGTSNRILYSGNDGGIYRSTNGGASFSNLNNGLEITQFYGAAINNNDTVIGGTQDNGTVRYYGVPNNWIREIGGDGGFCAADPKDPNYVYGEIYWIRVYQSSDGGRGWRQIARNGSNLRDRGSNFIPPFVLDPNTPSRMYIGGASLWRSDNVKATRVTWSEVKRPLPCRLSRSSGRGRSSGTPGEDNAHFAIDPPCNVSAVTVAPGRSSTVWVGHNNGEVWASDNATATTPTWRRVDMSAMPKRWCSRIAFDPNDLKRVYVTFMGYHGDNVWRTVDSGKTWTAITGSGAGKLPSAPCTSIAVHSVLRGQLYVGTDVGVFCSNDDGITWTTSSAGTGAAPIEELVWRNRKTLLVVTHGRGIWLVDSAESGGRRLIGKPCGLLNPSLDCSPPTIGQSMTWQLIGTKPQSPIALLLAGGRSKSLDLGNGCILRPNITTLVNLPMGTTSGVGIALPKLPIPPEPGLLGVDLTGQMLIGRSGGKLFGIAELSNGVEITIGL